MLTNLYCRLQVLRSQRGATAVEYGLMVSLIAVAIILVVTGLGATLKATFNDVIEAMGGTAVE